MTTPTPENTVRGLALQFDELVLRYRLPPTPCVLRFDLGDTIIWHCRNHKLERVLEVTTRRQRYHICDYNFDTDEVEIVEGYEGKVGKRLRRALRRLRNEMEG